MQLNDSIEALGTLRRRRFLQAGAALVSGALGASAFEGLGSLISGGRAEASAGGGGYGRLAPVRDLRDGAFRLALPQGFEYRSFGISGDIMSDGNKTPLAHDGMGLFYMPDGKLRLVRNHEVRSAPGAGGNTEPAAYDRKAGGGTTTLVVDPITRRLEADFISLTGTLLNCAGGRTPWGSWISCEETTAGLGSGWEQQHGYCFEVPSAANGPAAGHPLLAMGRFFHEAVAVDPVLGHVYETEDNGSGSGLYRFIPNTEGWLTAGRLQMLAVEGMSNYETGRAQAPGTILPVTWVPIDDPNPPTPGPGAVSSQGFANGAARFSRLEGCWFDNGALYFASTSGGGAGAGQLWEYHATSAQGGTLRLIFESPSKSILNGPDNLTLSPQGSLLICEDGDARQYLRGVSPSGAIFDFALNIANRFEWAGAVFADLKVAWLARSSTEYDGAGADVTLFVNQQGANAGPNPPQPGTESMTFAIWGPWSNGAL